MSLITLNQAQRTLIEKWAFDKRLWTDETVARINLETFARAILKERTRDDSNFGKLKESLHDAPFTWLPALLIRIVQLCHVKQVFADKEGLRRTVERAMQETIR